MPRITRIARVTVPVSDQDAGIAFYTSSLGFSLVADVPFGEGDRWVEVAPPGGGATIALVPVVRGRWRRVRRRGPVWPGGRSQM